MRYHMKVMLSLLSLCSREPSKTKKVSLRMSCRTLPLFKPSYPLCTFPCIISRCTSGLILQVQNIALFLRSSLVLDSCRICSTCGSSLMVALCWFTPLKVGLLRSLPQHPRSNLLLSVFKILDKWCEEYIKCITYEQKVKTQNRKSERLSKAGIRNQESGIRKEKK